MDYTFRYSAQCHKTLVAEDPSIKPIFFKVKTSYKEESYCHCLVDGQ